MQAPQTITRLLLERWAKPVPAGVNGKPSVDNVTHLTKKEERFGFSLLHPFPRVQFVSENSDLILRNYSLGIEGKKIKTSLFLSINAKDEI